MTAPASPEFATVDLSGVYNANRSSLPECLQVPDRIGDVSGDVVLRGIPFALGGGAGDGSDVLLLEGDRSASSITFDEHRTATYVLFLHLVGDTGTPLPDELAHLRESEWVQNNDIGGGGGTYTLRYADGSEAERRIERRLAIQQSTVNWGASAMAAVPATADRVYPAAVELTATGEPLEAGYGRGETRTQSGRESEQRHAWIYALPNPHPTQPIEAIELRAEPGEVVAVFGVTTTQLTDHPLRPGTRRKARVPLPDGVELNAADELEQIDIDLGTVISARAALSYDREQWLGDAADVQPARETREVLVEYAAHPAARLFVGEGGGADGASAGVPVADLASGGLVEVAAAERPVTIRVVERGSGQPVAVRFHAHGEHGEYLPPKGYHRKVNTGWFEDNYAELANGANQYAYIPGECVIDLPLGRVYLHVTRGYEVTPLRTAIEVTADTSEITLELDRALDWRTRGWVTADTHVHFLSPQTALLEGAAEGVNVVNLLASQWGEMFSNTGDFDGKTTFGADELGSGTGAGAQSPTSDFVVRVGSENRMQVLGHISLLGYQGSLIHPLCSGGPGESAIGDPQEVTMAQWAQQCIDQQGLVVMPHAPNPQCERAADIILDLVHATEMMVFNPTWGQLNPYGIIDWYRYLNLGYRLPVVGGSDKMSASSQLGGVRTYAHLGDEPFSYESWMAAVKRGHTFVTIGPLVDVTVEGQSPGGQVALPAGGGTVQVEWQAASVNVPITTVEVIVGGLVHETVTVDGMSASGSTSVPVSASSWVAIRVRGGYRRDTSDHIAAHTSAVEVTVDGARPWSDADAGVVLSQIEGSLAYIDTLAPRPDADRYRKLRATLEAAHNRFHQMLHRHGVYHDHTPIHDHHEGHEH